MPEFDMIKSLTPIIRCARPEDAPGIHAAHMCSVQTICSKSYSQEEIDAWGFSPYNEEGRLSSIKNDLVWVVELDGSIEGYGHLQIYEEDGIKQAHIFGLYLTPRAAGRSYGSKIMGLMFDEMKAARVKRATLLSSINANEFYRAAGFVESGSETHTKIGGTPIRCYPMVRNF